RQMDLDFDEVLSPGQMKEIVDLKEEGYRFVQHLEVRGRRTFLRMFGDTLHVPSEQEISAAFKRLLEGPVTIAFATGHRDRSADRDGERNSRPSLTARRLRAALVNQGFDVLTMSLDEPLPAAVDILVIADPKDAFTSMQQQNLREYIARGGNLLVAGDAGR